MKIQGLKKVLAALFFAPVIFTACEEFEADEILVPLTARETQDSTPITQTQNEPAILIEDFTGWNFYFEQSERNLWRKTCCVGCSPR